MPLTTLQYCSLMSDLWVILYLLVPWSSSMASDHNFNHTLLHQHPYPQHVAQHLNSRVNVSLWKMQKQSVKKSKDHNSCLTGNPIDDCWRCDPDWPHQRQRLADCGLGFGRNALGGKGGPFYTVTDSSDPDPKSPKPGTLRHAVSKPGPLWIVFAADMVIKLRRPLVVTSYKTIDGRGARVGVTGGGCISVEKVTNVIIHNINVYNCVPADNSDGDGIHIFNSANVWVDHCVLSNCADGLIDVTFKSTAVTISNTYFYSHVKVMLLGHTDDLEEDKMMQVTVAFNRFGKGLVERMPRCRHGYFHVVNNDYIAWGMYAVGGSASPTINSQGNRYLAPDDRNSKEVTKRMDDNSQEWKRWDWRTEGDIMLNGAFFVASGSGGSSGTQSHYAMASSFAPKSATFIDHLTLNAGLLLPNGGAALGLDPGSAPHGTDDWTIYGKAPTFLQPFQSASIILSCFIVLTILHF